MNKVRAVFILVIMVLGFSNVFAQELNCNVIINSQGAQSIDKRVFDDMKKQFQDFMNTRRWTNDNYKNEERIACNLLITIKKNNGTTNFECTAQIQSIRPVYSTGYETLMLSFLDENFNFDYAEGQPMDFNENSYFNNITSMLAFYAYMILAYDYDSFSKGGGRPWYLKAQQIALNAASGANSGKGWTVMDGSKSRGALLETITNQQSIPFREGLYNYHRLGLDVYTTNKEETHKQIVDMVKKIKTVLDQKPIHIAINIFFDAKANEIVNFLTDAAPAIKQDAYNTLNVVDPTRTEQYSKLLK